MEVLAASSEGVAVKPVCVEIAKEQYRLKEDQAGEPDGRGSPKCGKQPFGGHGLNQEEEESREKGGSSIEEAGGGHGVPGVPGVVEFTAYTICALHVQEESNDRFADCAIGMIEMTRWGSMRMKINGRAETSLRCKGLS